jgi:hypothetical protein
MPNTLREEDPSTEVMPPMGTAPSCRGDQDAAALNAAMAPLEQIVPYVSATCGNDSVAVYIWMVLLWDT